MTAAGQITQMVITAGTVPYSVHEVAGREITAIYVMRPARSALDMPRKIVLLRLMAMLMQMEPLTLMALTRMAQMTQLNNPLL